MSPISAYEHSHPTHKHNNKNLENHLVLKAIVSTHMPPFLKLPQALIIDWKVYNVSKIVLHSKL